MHPGKAETLASYKAGDYKIKVRVRDVPIGYDHEDKPHARRSQDRNKNHRRK